MSCEPCGIDGPSGDALTRTLSLELCFTHHSISQSGASTIGASNAIVYGLLRLGVDASGTDNISIINASAPRFLSTDTTLQVPHCDGGGALFEIKMPASLALPRTHHERVWYFLSRLFLDHLVIIRLVNFKEPESAQRSLRDASDIRLRILLAPFRNLLWIGARKVLPIFLECDLSSRAKRNYGNPAINQHASHPFKR